MPISIQETIIRHLNPPSFSGLLDKYFNYFLPLFLVLGSTITATFYYRGNSVSCVTDGLANNERHLPTAEQYCLENLRLVNFTQIELLTASSFKDGHFFPPDVGYPFLAFLPIIMALISLLPNICFLRKTGKGVSNILTYTYIHYVLAPECQTNSDNFYLGALLSNKWKPFRTYF